MGTVLGRATGRGGLRGRLVLALLVFLTAAACTSTTTENSDLTVADDGPWFLRDGVAGLVRGDEAGRPCWTIVTDQARLAACAGDSGDFLEVDQVLAGNRATAVGGVVDKRVRKVEINVDGVRRDARLKDGFFLRLIQARGRSTVRAVDGSGDLLTQRTFGAVPSSAPAPTTP